MTNRLSENTKIVVQESKGKEKFRKVIAEGIAMYANVHSPRKAYTAGDPPVYVMDLIVDEANAKLLEAEGLKPAKVQVDEDTRKAKEYATHPGMKVFTLKRKTVKKDGTAMSPPQVIDAATTPIPPTTLIGNGSRVRVSVNPFTFELKGKSITGSSLLGVQVLDLVEFTSNGGGGTGLEKTTGYKTTLLNTGNTASLDNDESPFGND